MAALGFAAYENPEVQGWIDEQRRRLADLLRGIGEELDPQSRREAEAFAFPGQATNRRDERPTAETTGAAIPDNTVRRVPVQGRMSEADTEERQRLGREYLAARNQLLRVMRQRRDGTVEQDTTSGIKMEDATTSSTVKKELNPESSNGAPPLPPKIKLETLEPAPVSATGDSSLPTMPGSFDQPEPEETYEEQLARAITLSEQESTPVVADDTYDEDVRKAVEASLKDFSSHVSAQDAARVRAAPVDLLTDDLPRTNVWQDDDLYNATPHLTRASLAEWNQQPLEPAVHNPFADSSRGDLSSATSWTLEGDSYASAEQEHGVAAVDESDEESSHVVTPDSWTEVGSLHGEVIAEHQHA